MVQIDLVNDTGVLTVYPVNLIGYLPYLMSPEDGKVLLNELSPKCDQLNITENGTGVVTFNLTKDK